MDDVFTIIVFFCAALWICGLLLRRNAVEGSVRADLAASILDWRSFYVALAVITVFRICLYEMFWIPSASMQPTLREGEFIVVDKNVYGIRIPLVGERVSDGRDPQRGEIVVFLYPKNEDTFFVKRLVGLPGDKLTIEGNSVSINGNELDRQGPESESYVYYEDNDSGLITGMLNVFNSDPGEEVSSLMYWERMPEGWHPFLLANNEISPKYTFSNKGCTPQQGGQALECVIPDDSYFVMGDNRHRSNDSRFWGFVPRSNLVGPATRIAISFDGWQRFFIPLTLAEEPGAIDVVSLLGES